jgi:hypothetical protein
LGLILAGVGVAFFVGAGSERQPAAAAITTSTAVPHPRSADPRYAIRPSDSGGGVAGSPLPGIAPAKLHHGAWGWLPPDVQSPVTSSWQVASHRKVTEVFAGADGADRSIGLFAIMRWNHVAVTQKVDFVKVPGAGPLTITAAPEGRRVVVSAQRDGDFSFRSASGITGTLHLADDSVTLNP